jgi:hypothetical protein
MIFSKDEARVELNLNRSDADDNKRLFDNLFDQKDKIEAEFGAQFDWRRMDTKKACRIVFAKAFDGYIEESWPEMISWLSEHVSKLETAFRTPLATLNQQLRKRVGDATP